MELATSPELDAFAKTVRDWVEREAPKARARELEQTPFEYPFELWDQMADAGFHAVGIAEEHGGHGGDATTQVVLAGELARSLAGLAWVWGLSSFAGANVLQSCGSQEQRERLLPGLAAGDTRFAIAVTEPAGGTDLLGAMQTHAERVDGGWSVSGQKMWSTGAKEADYLLVLARTDPDATGGDGTILVYVPNPAEGLELRYIPKLGMKCLPSCEVFLDAVFVPDDLVLGEPGAGWSNILGTLNNERIVLAGICCGIIEGVLEDAVAYLNQREAFGRTIGEFQTLQHYIADIAMWHRQALLVTRDAAQRQANGQPCAEEALMAKTIGSEYAVQAADLGIQMLGGMGYALETDMQRYWRDARLYRIVPITNEMARNLIAEAQGLPRSF